MSLHLSLITRHNLLSGLRVQVLDLSAAGDFGWLIERAYFHAASTQILLGQKIPDIHAGFAERVLVALDYLQRTIRKLVTIDEPAQRIPAQSAHAIRDREGETV